MNEQAQNKHPLQKLVERQIKTITNDGRVFIGILRGVDQAMNCVLSDTEERIYRVEAGVDRQKLGIYMIRGDSIVMIGQFIQESEEAQQLDDLKCKPLGKCE